MCNERIYLWDVLLVGHVGWSPASNWHDRPQNVQHKRDSCYCKRVIEILNEVEIGYADKTIFIVVGLCRFTDR